jgi:hypothetical protein
VRATGGGAGWLLLLQHSRRAVPYVSRYYTWKLTVACVAAAGPACHPGRASQLMQMQSSLLGLCRMKLMERKRKEGESH